MSKIETEVSTLKINRGAKAKIIENLSSIGENELIITTDEGVGSGTQLYKHTFTGQDGSEFVFINNNGTQLTYNSTRGGFGVSVDYQIISCYFISDQGGLYYGYPGGNLYQNVFYLNKISLFTQAQGETEKSMDSQMVDVVAEM